MIKIIRRRLFNTQSIEGAEGIHYSTLRGVKYDKTSLGIGKANKEVGQFVRENTWQGFPPFDLFALNLFKVKR